MSRIPDFTAVDFAAAASAAPAGGESWLTPEGIPVKPAYGPDDVKGIDFLDTWPGIAPYLRGPYPTMYVTQPWTIHTNLMLREGTRLREYVCAENNLEPERFERILKEGVAFTRP